MDEHSSEVCVQCRLGLHNECSGSWTTGTDGGISFDCCCHGQDFSDPFAEQPKKGRGGITKDPVDMNDPLSTGRKRASMIAPIFQGMVCEWAYLKFAGGGIVPITGCDGNLLSADTKAGDGGDLHHGPDKNTLNNTPGVNLHRICKSCHHRWHGKNNRFYPEPRPSGDVQWLPKGDWLPHDAITRATEDELQAVAKLSDAVNRKERDLRSDVELL